MPLFPNLESARQDALANPELMEPAGLYRPPKAYLAGIPPCLRTVDLTSFPEESRDVRERYGTPIRETPP
jgi:hypothetical protein